MKSIRYLIVSFLFAISAQAFAVDDCAPVADAGFGNNFGVDKVKATALDTAVENAVNEANENCVGYLGARCRAQIGCKFGELTEEPDAVVGNTSCFYDDFDKKWTCVADAKATCAATCSDE